MKKILTIIFLIPFLLKANNPFETGHYVTPIFGTQYYVSLSGSDGNNGLTLGTAWRTNVYAGAHTVNGDNIYTQAGTFSETATIVIAPGVTWHGIDTSSTIIKSNVTGNFVPLLDMGSVTEGTNGNQSIYDLKFDGQLTNFLPIFIGGRSNVSVHDCSFRDFEDRGVIFSGKDDYTDGAPSIYATGNSFYNNRVLNCAKYIHFNGSYGQGCLNIGGQDGLLVYNNVIIQNQRAPGDNGWPIKLHGTGYMKGIKIHDNVLTKNKFLGNYPGDGDWDFAVELWYSQGGCEIYNNTITGGVDLAENYKTGSYTYSWYVHDNVISQPTLNDKFQGGVYFERYVEGAIVSNNTFDKLSSAVIMNIEDFGVPFQALSNIYIQKNLMTNMGIAIGDGNAGSGIWVYCDATATFTIDGLYIDNNTIVAASGNAPFEGLNFNYGNAVGTTNNLFIRNNIVQGFYDYWCRSGNAVSTIDTCKVQNNNVYLNANSNAVLFAYGDPTHLTKTGNIGIPGGSNPQFVGGSDYTLQVSSPCIDAGIDIGLPFFNSAPDIGYAEYGSNIYPTANAGADTTIVYPTSSLTITGSGTDGDGTIVSKLWTVVSGSATITNGTTYSPTFSNISGTIVVRLTVTDDNAATGNDDRTITYIPSSGNTIIVPYVRAVRNR